MFERHQLSNTPEYSVWHGIKDRCLNPNSCNWSRYGARGITICDRWRNSFLNFYNDMGKRPSDQHSIERKNNDGHYEPDNCIWATIEQQVYNRSTNVFVKLSDKDDFITTKKAMEILNMKKGTFFTRLRRNQDLTKPVKNHKTIYDYNGRKYSVKELCQLSENNSKFLTRRLREGMEIEKAINMPKQEVRKYLYKNQDMTINEIAKLENIRPEPIRYGLNRGLTIEEVIEFVKRNNIQVVDQNNGTLISVKSDLNKRHGETSTIEHRTWSGFKAVCYNPRHPDYKYYGAKGATICDDWRYSYLNFIKDVGRRPTSEHSLRVIDKTKPIALGNVEWRLRDKDYIDRPKAMKITLSTGRQVYVNEAAELLKVGRSTLYNYIKNGVSISDLIDKVSKK